VVICGLADILLNGLQAPYLKIPYRTTGGARGVVFTKGGSRVWRYSQELVAYSTLSLQNAASSQRQAGTC